MFPEKTMLLTSTGSIRNCKINCKKPCSIEMFKNVHIVFPIKV